MELSAFNIAAPLQPSLSSALEPVLSVTLACQRNGPTDKRLPTRLRLCAFSAVDPAGTTRLGGTVINWQLGNLSLVSIAVQVSVCSPRRTKAVEAVASLHSCIGSHFFSAVPWSSCSRTLPCQLQRNCPECPCLFPCASLCAVSASQGDVTILRGVFPSCLFSALAPMTDKHWLPTRHAKLEAALNERKSCHMVRPLSRRPSRRSKASRRPLSCGGHLRSGFLAWW